MSNIKNANINIKIKDLFFKWIEITKTFHKLNNQQSQVLALLLYYHYLLKKDITNNKILWRMVFDYDTKIKIREDDIFKSEKNTSGLSNSSLQNIITNLRSKKIIQNGEISPAFIPDLTNDSKNFKIVFNFNIVDNE